MSKKITRKITIIFKEGDGKVWIEMNCSVCGQSHSEIIGLTSEVTDIQEQAEAGKPAMVKFGNEHEHCIRARKM